MALRRRFGLFAAVAVLTPACGAVRATGSSLPVGTISEVDVVTSLSSPDSGPAVRTTVPAAGPLGARVSGNRVLMIGDSVLASTSRRYDDEMCTALVPLGWQVEIDAEVGRYVEFGQQVIDRRRSAGWNGAVVFLGNNYGDDQDNYTAVLDEIVTRLAPMPVVLVTVSEFTPTRREVNDAIRSVAARHRNTTVLDWAATTAADPRLLSGDRLHLSTAGRAGLAANLAAALGVAPARPGACLPTTFTDDSGHSPRPTG